MKKTDSFIQRYARVLVLVTVIVISLVLLSCTLFIYTEYSAELKQQAATEAELITANQVTYLSREITECVNKARQAASKVKGMNTLDDVANALRHISSDEAFSGVAFSRFFSGGKEYGTYAQSFDLERDNVRKYMGTGTATCCGLAADREWNTNCIVFYAPVSNGIADGVLLYFPTETFCSFTSQIDPESYAGSLVTVLESQEGESLVILNKAETVELSTHSNIFSYLTNMVNDKSVIDNLIADLEKSNSTAYQVSVFSQDSVVAIGCAQNGGGISFISLYTVEALCGSGYTLINTILGVLVLVFLLLIFTCAFIIIQKKMSEKRKLEAEMFNVQLNCPTRIKFEKDVSPILAQHPGTKFVIVVSGIKHYQYIQEYFGYSTAEESLQYIKLLIEHSMQVDELYGYMGEGKFVLLLHYKEREDYVKRLNTIGALAYNHKGMLPDRYHLELGGGAFELEKNRFDSVTKMVDYAIEAENSAVLQEVGNYKFYTDKIRESQLQNADIEIRMESALKQGEFKVVYQPKYSIPNDRPDGCEALVRWYDAERDEYRSPGLFMPLFEANGFVVKLDKYVYEQCLKYISDSIENGQTLYPVSINVSRVTAIQPDFLEYYIELKKHYNIADYFVTLEFTESVAYENYELLRGLIDALHKNGFKCSIDDFGSGYSSYNILKELPMDEVKLDTFFIKRGVSAERDFTILHSVISVAKKLGMKVTQEGVETKDEMDILKKLGCDVVQGYHYSKPLLLTDYVSFISDPERSSGR